MRVGRWAVCKYLVWFLSVSLGLSIFVQGEEDGQDNVSTVSGEEDDQDNSTVQSHAEEDGQDNVSTVSGEEDGQDNSIAQPHGEEDGQDNCIVQPQERRMARIIV